MCMPACNSILWETIKVLVRASWMVCLSRHQLASGLSLWQLQCLQRLRSATWGRRCYFFVFVCCMRMDVEQIGGFSTWMRALRIDTLLGYMDGCCNAVFSQSPTDLCALSSTVYQLSVHNLSVSAFVCRN